jgi:glycosyltransferase involved in cell wall biosynthesis
MSAERIVALVGRRDEPTDGVADYCSWLGGALSAHGYELETVRAPWFERGWSAALADLREKAAAWRGCWVLLQFTTLAWSRRGFPLRAPRILSILRENGVQCGVVFHDFAPASGSRMIDRARQYCQLSVLKKLHNHAERSFFTVSMEKIAWLSPDSDKDIFIPVGANIPEPLAHDRINADGRKDGKKTVAVFSVTGGPSTLLEVADIGFAVKRASRAAGPVRVRVMGRGSKDAEPTLRAEFSGTSVELEILGLLSAEDTSQSLARADVQLFVRGQISSHRGSAIAGIACGLPVVCYAGPETGWPVTEAGILSVPRGDREALSAALETVLMDDGLRASLAERSRQAQARYFSWQVIASQFAQALRGSGDTSATAGEKSGRGSHRL